MVVVSYYTYCLEPFLSCPLPKQKEKAYWERSKQTTVSSSSLSSLNMSDVKYPLPPSNVVQSSSCHPPPPPPTPPSFNDNDNNNFDFHVSSNRIPQHDVDNRYLEQQQHHNHHNQQQSVDIATTSTEHLAATTTTARGSNQDEDPDLAMTRRNRPLSFSSLSRDEVEKPSGGSGSGMGENGGQRQVISISTPDPSHLFW